MVFFQGRLDVCVCWLVISACIIRLGIFYNLANRKVQPHAAGEVLAHQGPDGAILRNDAQIWLADS